MGDDVLYLVRKAGEELKKLAESPDDEKGWHGVRYDDGRWLLIVVGRFGRKAMGTVIRLPSGRYCLFLKGASEILAKKSACRIVASKDADQALPSRLRASPSRMKTLLRS